MDLPFWKNKRVFITGHTGFKGSWLSLWLARMGAQICGYALPPATHPSLYNLAGVTDVLESRHGDIRDHAAMTTAIAAFQPDIVFHLAAQAIVRPSYKNPVETYATNVMGTVHLLDAVRLTPGIKVVINVTSDKCYENREWHWGYREDEPMGGRDPYSSSKGCAELVTAAYRNTFFHPSDFARHGVALASVRAGNVIGGGDWAEDRLIPDLVRAFMAGQPARIRNPNAVRPWQHVLDALSGYLLLAEKLYEQGDVFAEGWNFGPADMQARPVGWVVQEVIRQWGKGADYVTDHGEHPHEAQYLKLDSSKAHARLGWRPRLTAREALEWTVQWYQDYQQRRDLSITTYQQIESYLGRNPENGR